ncbi:hypothetical protein ACOME3_002333 [Neoechinorhynchus agilis]
MAAELVDATTTSEPNHPKNSVTSLTYGAFDVKLNDLNGPRRCRYAFFTNGAEAVCDGVLSLLSRYPQTVLDGVPEHLKNVFKQEVLSRVGQLCSSDLVTVNRFFQDGVVPAKVSVSLMSEALSKLSDGKCPNCGFFLVEQRHDTGLLTDEMHLRHLLHSTSNGHVYKPFTRSIGCSHLITLLGVPMCDSVELTSFESQMELVTRVILDRAKHSIKDLLSDMVEEIVGSTLMTPIVEDKRSAPMNPVVSPSPKTVMNKVPVDKAAVDQTALSESASDIVFPSDAELVSSPSAKDRRSKLRSDLKELLSMKRDYTQKLLSDYESNITVARETCRKHPTAMAQALEDLL